MYRRHRLTIVGFINKTIITDGGRWKKIQLLKNEVHPDEMCCIKWILWRRYNS